MKKVRIAPSILAADFSQLGEEVLKVTESGADLIHFGLLRVTFLKLDRSLVSAFKMTRK